MELALALGIGLTTLCLPVALADGDGVGAGGEKVAYAYAAGWTGTLMVTAPALAKVSTIGTVSPPLRVVVRLFEHDLRRRPAQVDQGIRAERDRPAGQRHRLAVPGALTDTSLSPLLSVDSGQEEPGRAAVRSVRFSAGPSTNALST